MRRSFGAVAVAYLVLLFLSSPLALLWLGWFLSDGGDEISHRVHEISFGTLFAFIFVGVAAQLRSPERQIAGMQQALVAAGLFAVVEVAASGSADPLLAVYLLPLLVLAVLHPARVRLLWPPMHPSWRLLLVALPVVPALLVMAFVEIDLASRRAGGHVEHWGAMAAFAFAILALVLLAVLRVPGWRVTTWSAAAGMTVYAAASVAYPGDASSAVLRSDAWAVLAFIWAGALVLVAERWATRRPRAAPLPQRPMVIEFVLGLVKVGAVTGLVLVLLFVGLIWSFTSEPLIPHQVSETNRAHCLSCHGTGINVETEEENVPRIDASNHPDAGPPGRCVDCHEEGGFIEIEGASGAMSVTVRAPTAANWATLRAEQAERER